MKNLLVFFSLTAFVLVGMSSCAAEDEYSIYGGLYGTVIDAETGQPIQSANVVLSPTNVSTVTGSDGIFEFQNLESQQYSMTVTKSGYLFNSRQVTVLPGQNISGDITLTPESEITGFSLSTEMLAFGSTYSALTFTITNNSSSSATSWTISGVDADWLSVSPSSGTISLGQQSAVIVSIDRDYVTEDKLTYFIVNAAGGSKQVGVSASKASSGGGNGSDVSYGTVSSPFKDMDFEITDVYMLGDYFYLEYLATWNGTSKINYYSVIGYSNNIIANDDLGNVYAPGIGDKAVSLGGGDFKDSVNLEDITPGTKFKGSLRLMNIDVNATKFTSIKLYSYKEITTGEYGDIYFYNVPIIR
ncbi:MAG: carboxypeptidase regulatory-like domain-containing protein [Rikenellaceae bacterium]